MIKLVLFMLILGIIVTPKCLAQEKDTIGIWAIRQNPTAMKSLIHDLMQESKYEGARLATVGEVDGAMFHFDNTFKGTDAFDILFLEHNQIPHIVHVRGSSYEQMNKQYAKYAERFKRGEIVILFFDKYTFFERESGYVVNTHIQFVRAMRSGNVTRGDYDAIDSARFTIALGKRLKNYRYPNMIELKPKVAEIVESYIDGARLAGSSV